eukprot:771066-Alexandrium_andersonii.AAC.1
MSWPELEEVPSDPEPQEDSDGNAGDSDGNAGESEDDLEIVDMIPGPAPTPSQETPTASQAAPSTGPTAGTTA